MVAPIPGQGSQFIRGAAHLHLEKADAAAYDNAGRPVRACWRVATEVRASCLLPGRLPDRLSPDKLTVAKLTVAWPLTSRMVNF